MSELPHIPGYRLGRLLGQGASGTVFLAREAQGLERLVALKVFASSERDSYERELSALKQIDEVRRRERALELLQALDTGEHQGTCWIALEYMEEGSLAERVAAEGPLPLAQVLEIARDVARGLGRLHAAGLFHRDVKPQNLLWGSDGRVRLGDFGLSRSLDGTLSAAGSPAYAAPEVIAGRISDGRLADLYSLGASLIFLLSGETILPGRPDVFVLERAGVPRWLQEVLTRATAVDPGERWGDMSAFQQALQEKSDFTRLTPSERDVPSEEAPPAGALGGMRSVKSLSPAQPTPALTKLAQPLGVDHPRCPYCHEPVRPGDEAKKACQTCMAWHHQECWETHMACAACNQSEAPVLVAAGAGAVAVATQPQLSRLALASLLFASFPLALLLLATLLFFLSRTA